MLSGTENFGRSQIVVEARKTKPKQNPSDSTWQKGKMKASKNSLSLIATAEAQRLARPHSLPQRLTSSGFAWLGSVTLAVALLSLSYSARAAGFVPFGEGTLASGQIVSMFQVTFDPGESFPWHFHPGPLWGVIVSGTLTEDEGCGTALNTYVAGSAFSETPGRVHRVFNFGTVPVVINFTAILPPCYANYNNAILVQEPRCEGKSGESHLEKIPDCPEAP